MLGRIMSFELESIVLFGIGALGLLLKILFSGYLSRLVRASENITTTRKKSIKCIRQKFENCKSLGKACSSSKAYVEKNIRRLKFLALPIELWKKSGRVLIGVCVMLMTTCFWIYGSSWVGQEKMYNFLFSGIFVVSFLVTLENIFLVSNKLEILKANLVDYLDNLSVATDGRNSFTIKRVIGKEEEGIMDGKYVHKDCEAESAVTEEVVRGNVDDSGANNEEALNSFLKEFFT